MYRSLDTGPRKGFRFLNTGSGIVLPATCVSCVRTEWGFIPTIGTAGPLTHLFSFSPKMPTSVPTPPSSPVQPAPIRGGGERSRGWCWTINNPTDADRAGAVAALGAAVHGVFGAETGDSGTPHLQGYCEFKNARTLAQVKALLPRAHLEIRKGSPRAAWDYCCKEDTNPTTHGERPEAPAPGKRTDIERAASIVKDFGIQKLAEEMPAQARLFRLLEARLSPVGYLPCDTL